MEDIARQLRELRLGVISCHVPLDRLENELDKVIAEQRLLGCDTVVCPWLEEDRRKGRGAFEKVGATLDEIGKMLRRKGIHL